jgi:tetratricopeptide (TPR) repeat protein
MLGSFTEIMLPACLFDSQGALTLDACKYFGWGLEAWASVIGVSVFSLLALVLALLRGAGIYLFALYQRWRSVGRISPASGNRISVLLIRLQGDDASQSLRQSIIDGIQRELGNTVEIIKWPLGIADQDGHEADNERLTFSVIQKWLRITSCDVAVWGRVKSNDILSLRFTVPEFGTKLPENYSLTDELELPRKFIQTLGLAIVMRVCALEWSIRPKLELINYLSGSVSRLELIIRTEAFDDGVKAALILTYARALLTIGEKQNSASQIQRAIDTYKTALEVFTAERSPLIWRAISVALATALCSFGRRYNPRSFVEAEAIYRTVLQQIDPAVDPVSWGTVACDLGNALAGMGGAEDPEKLKEAISFFKEIANVCTREKTPLLWAFIMCSSGLASISLGEQQTTLDGLLDGVGYFEAALKEWTRVRYPFLWASAQKLLANAYRLLGERRTQRDDLVNAIICGRNALKEIRRSNEPIVWAHCQTNLGISHLALAQLTESVIEANKALRAIRLASAELTPAAGMPDFIMSQINLGHALLVKGTFAKNSNILWAAIDACNFGMNSVDLSTMSLRAAMLLNNLGSAQTHLGALLGRTESFEEAFVSHSLAKAIYKAARATYYIERTDRYVAALLRNIGMFSTNVHSTGRWLELLASIAELRDASNEKERRSLTRKLQNLIHDEAMSSDSNFLAYAFFHFGYRRRVLAELTGDRAELEGAKRNLMEAARLWAQTHAALAWARAQYELGAIYLREAELGSHDGLDNALLCSRRAIAKRKRRQVPRDWAMAKVNLTSVYGLRSAQHSSWKALFYSWEALRNCCCSACRMKVPQGHYRKH